MKIACPQCQTWYELNPAALGSAGRQVRCSRCQAVWFARPPMLFVDDLPATIESSDPAPSGPLAIPAFTVIPAESPSDPSEPVEPAAQQSAADAEGQHHAGAPVAQPDRPVVEAAEPATVVAAAPPAPSEAEAMPPESIDAPKMTAAMGEPPAEASAITVDVESVARRRFSRRKPARKPAPTRWRMSRIAAIVAALAAIDAGLIIWRDTVVRLVPQTAALFSDIGLPVNLRQLAFRDIHMTYEQHDGSPILVVAGKIVPTGKSVVDVPRLRFSIQAENGHEIYAWTALPTRSRLAPGETLPFRTRLASPPEQGRTIQVRFFNRLDIASGVR